MAHNGNRGQINLNNLKFDLAYPFINHLKTASIWDYSDFTSRPDVAFMNAQGLPKNLNGKTWRVNFSKPGTEYYSGNWIVDWIGEITCTVQTSSTVSGSNSGVNGRWVITTPQTYPAFSITAINTSNPPTQVRMYREDHEALLLAGEIYTPLFIEKMSKAGVIRPDTQQSNQSNVALWRDRTPMDYFSYASSWWDITRDAGVTSNTGDAYSGTPPGGYTRTDKCKLHVRWNFTNTTTTPTYDDGGGAKVIKSPIASALGAGSLISGRRDTLTFDEGLDCWLNQTYASANEFDEGIYGGLPPEALIALCNATGAHAHINFPHFAADTLAGITDYAHEFASLCESTLNSGLQVRTQIGNELFNGALGFFSAPYASAKGLNRWGAVGSQNANYNWQGRALSLVGAEFAATSPTKCKVWANVQSAGSPDLSSVRSTIIESPRHVSDGGNPASDYVEGVFMANYWASRSRYPTTVIAGEANFHFFIADAWEWATASEARKLELTEQFYTFNNGAQDFIDTTGQERYERWWGVAQNYGKKLACYEGGNSEDHIGSNPRCRVLGISKAANAVVTMPSGHGFRTGMKALFRDIQGMTEINNLTGTVQSYTDTTFTVDINSTGFSTFTGGTGGSDYSTADPTLRGVGFTGDGTSTGQQMCNTYLDAVRDSPITYTYTTLNLEQHISLADTEFPSQYHFSGDSEFSAHPAPGGIYTPNATWQAFEDFSYVAAATPTTPTTGGSGKGRGASPKRGLITPPPRIKWSKKKKANAVAEVTQAVQQVAKIYPEYKMDFAEEWRHIANLLLAENTLAQLRKIETAKQLADKIALVIEEDDEEVLLLM